MKKLVKGFASVILASMFVFIGCNQTTGGSKPTGGGSELPGGGSDPTGQKKITVTVAYDANVEKVEPATLSVAKGSTWSAIKSKINVTYNDGYVEAGWKVTDKNGADLTDDYPFNSDTTVFAVSKEAVTITVKGDERIDLPLTFEKPQGTEWANLRYDIEEKIKPTADWKDDWEEGDYEVYEWRLGDENGKKIYDSYTFTENTTVYAVSNYAKWEIEDRGFGNKFLFGVKGSKPRGKIILPAGVDVISDRTFTGCSALTAITIPASVELIRDRAFTGCTNLKTLVVHSSNDVYKSDNNIIYTKDGKSLIAVANSFTDITIPDSVTTIEVNAFSCCSALTSISIPASVELIRDRAFTGCKNLKTLVVDSGNEEYKSDNNIIYTKDGRSLIAVAGGLTDITIPDSVTTIEVNAFSGCAELTGITIPKNVTKIGREAFLIYDGQLTSVHFDDPTGWAVYKENYYINKTANIDELELKDEGTAAQLLSTIYYGNYWKKN
ncbi:MAG: leucine-rich repeat protein [Treponema phagedenis]|uniref:leucine-rich repeat domain-containing protein n=1 Tax=Treponema phagedenis TaxID=162 RepID=UPI0031341CA7